MCVKGCFEKPGKIWGRRELVVVRIQERRSWGHSLAGDAGSGQTNIFERSRTKQKASNSPQITLASPKPTRFLCTLTYFLFLVKQQQ